MNKIEISTSDEQDRSWTIVSYPAVVGFDYNVTVDGRESAKGWVASEHTALRVAQLLHALVDLAYEHEQVDDDEIAEATSGPCPVCGCRWSGEVDNIADRQERFDRYATDRGARERLRDQWADENDAPLLIPTIVVGSDGCTWEADRLWVVCPLCGGERSTHIALLEAHQGRDDLAATRLGGRDV